MRTAAVIAVMLASAHARADDTGVDSGGSSANRPGFVSEGALTGDWGGLRSDLFEHGVAFVVSYTSELFATADLDEDRVAFAGLAALEIDLDLSVLVTPRLGRFYTSSLGLHGRGLTAALMEVYGVSNIVATPEVRLFEAWLDQPLGPVVVRAGLLSVDQEFVLAEQSAVLIDASFGIPASFSYTIGNPVYPVAAAGASVRYEGDDLTVRAAIYDGDQPNTHGLPTGLGDDGIVLGEVSLASTFKVGGWHHTDRGTGYYAVLDRQLDRSVGAFARVSLAPDSTMPVFVDGGVRISPRRRPHDLASVGMAFARSDRGAQTLVEATYQLAATGWLTVQPDLQVLLRREGTAVVGALRTVIVF